MTKIVSPNYSYANNSSGDLINVTNAIRNENFFCPICGELMNPHMGKVRRWHFTHKNTIAFWLNKKGRFSSFDCHCYEVAKKLPSNVHYYITNIATPFKQILHEFSKRGVKIRNCFLCKYSKQDIRGERLCVLYKKHNLPRKPSPYCAVSCPHYREDSEILQNDMIPIEQAPSTEQTEYFQRHKFHCHICKNIL